MGSTTIPHFYNALRSRFQIFDPYLSGWEDVELSQLNNLQDFVENELVGFQELALNDMTSGYCASWFVSNIAKTINTFLSWAERLPVEYLNPKTGGDEKEHSLRKICFTLSCHWIPWIYKNYRQLAGDSTFAEKIQPAESLGESAKRSKEEREANEMREELFKFIIGASPEEKVRVFSAMKELVYGKGDRELAAYIKAAIEMKILTTSPNFKAMKLFWGVANTQGAMSKYFSKVDSLLTEEEVENKKSEIIYQLNIAY